MTPGAKSGEGGVPRRFAYNQDAAREREMHLYAMNRVIGTLAERSGRCRSVI